MCGLHWRLLAVGGKPDAALSQRLSSYGLAYMPLEAYKYKIYPWIQIQKRHVQIQNMPLDSNMKETRTTTKYALECNYERDLQVQNMQLKAVRKTSRRTYKISQLLSLRDIAV